MNSLLEKYIIEYNESESSEKVINFNVNHHIAKHEKAILILDKIKKLKRTKENLIDSIGGMAGTFPRLRASYVKKIHRHNIYINHFMKKYLDLWDITI